MKVIILQEQFALTALEDQFHLAGFPEDSAIMYTNDLDLALSAVEFGQEQLFVLYVVPDFQHEASEYIKSIREKSGGRVYIAIFMHDVARVTASFLAEVDEIIYHNSSTEGFASDLISAVKRFLSESS